MSRPLGLAAAAGLHILLLAVLLREVRMPPAEAPLTVRTQLVWARLPPPQRTAPAPAPVRQAAVARPSIPRPPAEAPIAEVAAPAPEAAQAAAPLNAAELVRMAGAVGKELSAGQKIEIASDSFQRKLERGMAAARDGVKPKWYEGARMELFSAPNDPRKIYKITTAFGEYCVFYPDKTKMEGNSGSAAYGQPTISSCPIRF